MEKEQTFVESIADVDDFNKVNDLAKTAYRLSSIKLLSTVTVPNVSAILEKYETVLKFNNTNVHIPNRIYTLAEILILQDDIFNMTSDKEKYIGYIIMLDKATSLLKLLQGFWFNEQETTIGISVKGEIKL